MLPHYYVGGEVFETLGGRNSLLNLILLVDGQLVAFIHLFVRIERKCYLKELRFKRDVDLQEPGRQTFTVY